MNKQQLRQIENWFEQYVKTFENGGELLDMQHLKLLHSRRVAQEAAQLAEELGWCDEDIYTARAIGILHDVGRFPQYAQYQTFRDSISVDHADFGYQTLLQLKPLEFLDKNKQSLILESVRHHNKKTVPQDLDSRTARFARLIRDADKLDIYHVVHSAIRKGEHRSKEDLLWKMDIDGPANPRLVKALAEKQIGDHSLVKSMADYLITQLCWTFDINYKPTMEKIAERKVMEFIRDMIADKPEINQAVKVALDYRDDFILGGIN